MADAVHPAPMPDAGASGAPSFSAPDAGEAPAPAPAAVVVYDNPLHAAAKTTATSPSPSSSSSSSGPSPADLPDVYISYNLSVTMELTRQQAVRSMPTVPEVLGGLLTAPFRAVAKAVTPATPASLAADKEAKETLHVLSSVKGVIRPASLTLLLAPPGAGKTTFLKALCSIPGGVKLDAAEGVGVRYGGGAAGEGSLTRAEAEARGINVGQLVQYVDQLDNHLPFLTVRETLEFIGENALVGGEATAKARVDDIVDLLHLKNCENTLIGNDLVRGVSGGERKRVTVGEGIMTRARALFCDEISTGLDSSVTYSVVNRLKARAQRERLGVVIALLQPTPEVYDLFDDVILMREGFVVYHGPRGALLPYFKGLGFHPPPPLAHAQQAASASAMGGKEAASGGAAAVSAVEEGAMDTADWLAEILAFPHRTHERDLARVRATAGGEALIAASPAPPLEPQAMADAWAGAGDLYARSTTLPANAAPLVLHSDFAKQQYGQEYVHSAFHHVRSVTRRQFKLMGRNSLFLGFRVFSATFMAMVFAGLYWRGGVEDGITKYGLFLNALMHVAFANISEMSSAVENKYVAHRHVANGVHPHFAFPLSNVIAHLPLAAAESIVFCAITYFLCGMTEEAGRFFFYLLLVFLVDVFASVLFRTFAFSAPTLITAQAGPMPIIALLIMFAGFMITPDKMPVWLAWLYYLDIFGWAILSLAQNEFFADRYAIVPPGGTTGGKSLGELYLTLFEMKTDPAYKWAGVGFVVGSIILVCIWQFWAFKTIRFNRNVGSSRVKLSVANPDSSDALTPADSSSSSATASAATPDAADDNASPVVAASVAVNVRSVLPFKPMTVAFENIGYTVNLPSHMGGGSKVLLYGISGYALPGRMLALMGASGAGKTTLLDVLASRKNTGTLAGRITLNGHPKEERTFNRVTAYVEQQDIHTPYTTVREALDFSARLRLPDEVTVAQKDAFIDEIMEILELSAIAGRKVGDVGAADGLSPGERKRLTIGVELASNAPVVFLDEPTSGLDARAAAVVMRVIKNVASTGRTVICTIHQPSFELFSLFDDLLLLQRGGWEVFFGPLGRGGAHLIHYLTSIPGTRPCPPGQNPASWMLDVLGGTDSSGAAAGTGAATGSAPSSPSLKPVAPAAATGDADAKSGEAPHAAAAASAAPHAVLSGMEYQRHLLESSLWKEVGGARLEALSNPPADEQADSASTKVTFTRPMARSFFGQYLILLGRHHRIYLRNLPFNLGRLFALIGLSILFGIIWYGIGERATDLAGVQSFVASIFMTATFAGMINMDTSVPVLIRTRPVFYREVASRLFDPLAHSLSLITVEIPWLAAIILIVLPISYFMLGLVGSAFTSAGAGTTAAGTFFFHYLVTVTQGMVFVSIGQTVAASAPSFDVAQACIGTVAPILFLFGGLFAPPSKMPAGARWVNVIDPVGYAFRALIPPQFHCEGGVAAGCPTIKVADPVYGLVTVDRDDFVETLYDFKYETRWDQLGYLAIFIIVFQTASILATRYVRHISR